MIAKTNIFYSSTIDSTNQALKAILDLIKPANDVAFIAKYQEKGKGQGTNEWESEKEMNLTFSLLKTNLALQASEVFLLNKLVAVAIVELLKQLKVENVKIKWPNDILVNGRKICGILINNILFGSNLQNSIIGIGLNVNQKNFNTYERQATSILLETGKKHEIWSVFENLLNILQLNFQLLVNNPSQFDRLYLENLYCLDEWRGYIIKGKRTNGKIIGVNNFGQLQMKISSEEIISLNMKEVKFL